MSKKKQKLIPLTINRKRWARGGKNGEAALLNRESNMCCLGFACRAIGFSKNDIKDEFSPKGLANISLSACERLDKLVVSGPDGNVWRNSEDTAKAIIINDSGDISDKMREYRLKPILRRLGFDVKFTG